MTFPFVLVFLALLVAYMVYSQWAGLDSRYLVAGALVLLVATAVVDAAGEPSAADTLAEFVFFLLAGGVVLLLVDHVRGRDRDDAGPRESSTLRARESDASDAAKERQTPPDQSLDDPE